MRHADPRTTLRYDMAKANLDRHAAHAVAAYLAGMSIGSAPSDRVKINELNRRYCRSMSDELTAERAIRIWCGDRLGDAGDGASFLFLAKRGSRFFSSRSVGWRSPPTWRGISSSAVRDASAGRCRRRSSTHCNSLSTTRAPAHRCRSNQPGSLSLARSRPRRLRGQSSLVARR